MIYTKRSFHYIAYLLAMLMMVLSAQSCTTLGYTDVDTTRKAILVANAEIRAGNLLLQDLIGRRAITKADADVALNSLQTAKNHLDTALSAIDSAGDPVLAGSSLDRAKVSLNVAIALFAPLVET